MQEVKICLQNSTGLHARPATVFTQMAAKFKSKVTVANGAKKSDAKSILGVLTLGAVQGSELVLTAEGADEEEAVKTLGDYLVALSE